MRESKIEKYFNKRISELGGLSLKIKFLGRRSCPDRIILFWPFIYFFAEFKAEGKKPTPAQDRAHEKLNKYGAWVFIPNSIEAVDAAIKHIKFVYKTRTGKNL